MELITSGLEAFPERLTPQAIYCLSYHDHEKIREMLFNVQIVAFKDLSITSPIASQMAANMNVETSIMARIAEIKVQQKAYVLALNSGGA